MSSHVASIIKGLSAKRCIGALCFLHKQDKLDDVVRGKRYNLV